MLSSDLLLDRRTLIGSLGASALALPGCATTQGRTRSSAACLPRVLADPSRVIRTVAGLRPYRPSGYVVRAEALGAKKLVHNYGHGGGGITMSWGTSRQATLLGLQGHQGPVAVIGAGVVGLTTARLVQEAGFPVTIYTKALPPETTSNIAGGQWHPFGMFQRGSVSDAWHAQFLAAADYSWRRFQLMVGDDYGVRWLPTYAEMRDGIPEATLFGNFPPDNRALRPDEHPFAATNLTRFTTIYVETGRFLHKLTQDVQIAGGRIQVRDFRTPAELGTLSEGLVFNCTGLGSRDLFGDTEMIPIRGQLAVIIPQPEVRYAYTGQMGYMFPRADGILLGGTFERYEYNATPQPEDIARIVESHRRFFGAMRCAV